eukprot:Protomagalhaensia_sp_Gyna_25__3230@NODE_293_length_4028_cov_22_524693_g227_i0_p4_GENE_NODE_293_length_4028_cov_22_524693_g227_i0NODE_293_length_4028_cov_22_524693_g227_i0_p4_ORF_typecomplete_len132_score7_46_NODE_293_length_4028_cov_22_524693_g227_i017272122
MKTRGHTTQHFTCRLCVSPDSRVQILVRPDKRPDQAHGRRKSRPLEVTDESEGKRDQLQNEMIHAGAASLSPVEAEGVPIESGVPASPTSHAASTESEDCFEGTNRRPSVLLRDIRPLTQVGEHVEEVWSG